MNDASGDLVKTVYSAPDPLIVGHLRNLLVNEGIACDVKTPFLGAARGDIPVTECWSQLYVLNDEDVERAMGLINVALQPGSQAYSSWRCSKCGEEIEGQFEECWQCGSARSGGDA